jgi:hypothetical protein
MLRAVLAYASEVLKKALPPLPPPLEYTELWGMPRKLVGAVRHALG